MGLTREFDGSGTPKLKNPNARVASRTSQCEAIQVEREMSRKMKKKATPRITQKKQEARGEIARLPLRLERVVVARKP